MQHPALLPETGPTQTARSPDLPCGCRATVTAAERTGHLAATVAGTVRSLLLADRLPWSTSESYSVMASGFLAEFARLKGKALLVRPDRYVAAIFDPESAPNIERWVATRLGRAAPGWVLRRFGAEASRLRLQLMTVAGRCDWLVGGRPSEVPDRYAQLSAINHVHSDGPRTLLVHGRQDEMAPVADTRRLQELLELAGEPVSAVHLPHTDHALDVFGMVWSPAALKDRVGRHGPCVRELCAR